MQEGYEKNTNFEGAKWLFWKFSVYKWRIYETCIFRRQSLETDKERSSDSNLGN